MSTILKLTAEEYDSMIEKGAFDRLQRRIELIRGELREMNPAGPVHEDYIDYLNRWSVSSTEASECVVRVQSSIDLDDSRPEPDIAWLKSGRYAQRRPQAADVLLIIEVADSSLPDDFGERQVNAYQHAAQASVFGTHSLALRACIRVNSHLPLALEEKAGLYAQFNIAEYWVVDIQGRCIHVHQHSDGHRYQEVVQVSSGQTIAPSCKSSALLVLAELFAD
jgi:Uma2 family endonuclease